MKEPTRWCEDPSVPPEHLRLLTAAAPPPPMTLGQSELMGAFASKLAAHGALSNWLTVSFVAKWLVVSATLGAAMTTGYMLTQPRPPLASTRPNTVVQAPAPETPAGFVTTNQQPQPVANPEGEISRNPPQSARIAPMKHAAMNQARDAARDSARDASTPPGSADNSIRDEAALLERARRALGESPLRALQLVDEHRQRFRSGQLAAERELIAVQALVSLGRSAQAEQRANQFYQSYQSSVYQRRMRQILGTSHESNIGANR